MFYILDVLVNLTLIWLCLSYKIKKIGLIAAVDIFSFFAEYVIISGFLFWLNLFSVKKSIVIMIILNTVALAVFFIRHKRLALNYEKISLNIPLVVVLLIAIPFSFFKFGYFGMGQDEGVYQVKAIDLMYTDTLRQKNFTEYEDLNDSQKQEYYTAVKKIAGYDLYKRKPTLSEEKQMTPVDGIYHGIPTYPAILALSGKMFGVENISALNSLIYLGIILLMNHLCENFKLKKSNSFLVMFVTALSPIVIWVMKSTLTELFLTLIFVSFLYFITAEDRKFNILMSAVSVATFSFFHVSIFTLIPFFILCYLIKYLKTGNVINFFASILSALSICVGMNMMLFTSPTYTTNNIVGHLFGLVNDYNCIFWLSLLAFAFVAIFAVVVFIKPINKFFIKFIKDDLFIYLFRIIYIIMTVVCIVNCIRNKDVAYNITYPFETNSLVAFAYLTGIVIVPAIIVLSVVKFRTLVLENSSFLIVFAFFYCVLFRSAFLVRTVPHYYYYARYLTPFIPIVAILCGIVITKRIVPYVMTAVVSVIIIPYDLVMFNTCDDTRLDWENLVDVMEYIDEKDAVVVENGFLSTYFIPIREISGAHVYPVFNSGLINECLELSSKYENVYVITDTDSYTFFDEFYSVYSDTTHESQDLQEYHNKLFPLPYNFYKNDYHINLLKYTSEKREYVLPDSAIIRSNFSNDVGFSWSLDENSELILPISFNETVNATIHFKNIIPFSNLNLDKFDVKIYLNGDYYNTVDLTKQTSTTLTLVPNSEKITISFNSQLWSPSWIGGSDTRMLGFAFEKILFSKFETKLNYSFENNDIEGTGFGAIENNRFAWTNVETPKVTCMLDKKEYNVKIKCSPLIDLSKMNVQSYDVFVYMNGKNIGVMKLGKTAEENEYMFKIPIDFVDIGNNILSFKSKLWSPKELGINNDTRKLGFALESIIFEEIE